MNNITDVETATRHWLEKAVIGLNLCPFARAVYVKNQVRIVVSSARHLDAFLDDLDRELTLLVNTPAEEIDTTLLVHATLFPDLDGLSRSISYELEITWPGHLQATRV